MVHRYVTRENCKDGMKVKLYKPNSSYKIGSANPAIGSKYECCGTIVDYGIVSINVEWENGTSNSYRDNELILVEDVGRCISIW